MTGSAVPRKATDKGPHGPKTFRQQRSLTLAENFSPGPLRDPRSPGQKNGAMRPERKDGHTQQQSTITQSDKRGYLIFGKGEKGSSATAKKTLQNSR